MMRAARFFASASAALLAVACAPATGPQVGIDKLAYHYGPLRQGWNDSEARLTPAKVAGADFGLLWQSSQLDSVDGVPPRLFASPLYLSDYAFTGGPLAGHSGAVSFVASSAGYAYAIATAPIADKAPGEILWRQRLTESPCSNGQMGILSTPAIDLAAGRLYVTSCEGDWLWRINALNLATGANVPGWPLEVSPATVAADLNQNGETRFVDRQPYIQRGALTLSDDGARLYVAFGPDMQGWLISVDTRAPRLASAFSSMPRSDMQQGGMWGSSGPAIDPEGRIYVASGASFANALANGGIAGTFPDADHAWGQSILQFTDSEADGLRLTGTYSPFNYCQTAAADIDIAGSGPVLFDLPGDVTSTHSLLALGAGKQGNAYLLDRDHMPGSLVRRHACSTDGSTDGSLLAPEVQPELGTRGPVSVFGPYSDTIGMANSAKSRSTLALFRSTAGATYLYFTGSTKTGADFGTNIAPSLARVEVIARDGEPAFLRKDLMEHTQVMQNPGSPVVSSHAGRSGIVWVIDPNVPRSTDIYDPRAPGAKLYAFDALTLSLLWSSGEELRTSGKYNEPAVVDGLVLVGSDRLQAYGLRQPGQAFAAAKMPEIPVGQAKPLGETLFYGRCASCHGSAAAGAPPVAQIGQLSREQIVAVLSTGSMQQMAAGLSAEDIAAIAAWLPGQGE